MNKKQKNLLLYSVIGLLVIVLAFGNDLFSFVQVSGSGLICDVTIPSVLTCYDSDPEKGGLKGDSNPDVPHYTITVPLLVKSYIGNLSNVDNLRNQLVNVNLAYYEGIKSQYKGTYPSIGVCDLKLGTCIIKDEGRGVYIEIKGFSVDLNKKVKYTDNGNSPPTFEVITDSGQVVEIPKSTYSLPVENGNTQDNTQTTTNQDNQVNNEPKDNISIDLIILGVLVLLAVIVVIIKLRKR